MLAHAGPEWRVPRPLDRQPNAESHIVPGLKSAAANIGLSRLRRGWGVACVRPGVWHKKFSWSALRVKWDCALKKHVSKITTQRHSSNNIKCDHLKKTWSLKPNGKEKKLKFLHIPNNLSVYSQTKTITAFLNTHRNVSDLFPKICRLIHYSIFFGSQNITFKCLAKRMSYAKVDYSHLNPDKKRLSTQYSVCNHSQYEWNGDHIKYTA